MMINPIEGWLDDLEKKETPLFLGLLLLPYDLFSSFSHRVYTTATGSVLSPSLNLIFTHSLLLDLMEFIFFLRMFFSRSSLTKECSSISLDGQLEFILPVMESSISFSDHGSVNHHYYSYSVCLGVAIDNSVHNWIHNLGVSAEERRN